MADRNLVTYLEETEQTKDGLTGYQIEIERSAAGQPGILITVTNALGEPSTLYIKDGLALFAPVLEWLLKDGGELETQVAHMANVATFAAREALDALVRIGLDRRDADTTDDGSPVQ